jgi:hypothetical protein
MYPAKIASQQNVMKTRLQDMNGTTRDRKNGAHQTHCYPACCIRSLPHRLPHSSWNKGRGIPQLAYVHDSLPLHEGIPAHECNTPGCWCWQREPASFGNYKGKNIKKNRKQKNTKSEHFKEKSKKLGKKGWEKRKKFKKRNLEERLETARRQNKNKEEGETDKNLERKK